MNFVCKKERNKMLRNHFTLFLVIGLLVIGALAFTGITVFAQQGQPVVPTQVFTNPADESIQSPGSGTVSVDLQVGDQDTADEQETIEAVDTDNTDVEEQVGDQNAADEQGEVVSSDPDNIEEQVGDLNATDGQGEIVASDPDNVEEQVGNQNHADEHETSGATDTNHVDVEEQGGD
jgi:cytoskeletal protein RodZ